MLEAALAELILLSQSSEMDRHVVFVHGLRRSGHKVWMSSGLPPELWPLWLSNDIEKLGIWSVEYESAPTRWRGNSMARSDRANNVLALLLSEERLKQGDISFVVHSFGGLVFEHLLRLANERASSDLCVANFVKRISRVTFLGTPHHGADLASLGGKLRLIARPSLAATGLERNDPDLRDLNQFYRNYAAQSGIETQSLIETRPIRWLGMVVKPDSADVGLPSAPIPVDADHFGIASPESRESEIYIHVCNHLRGLDRRRRTLISDPVSLDHIARDISTNTATLERIEQLLSPIVPVEPARTQIPSSLVDAETKKRLLRLRRMRFFVGSTHLEEASRLAHELLQGELSATSTTKKSDALAWCARLLFAKTDRTEALQILEQANKLARTEDVSIAEALQDSYEDNTSAALSKLALLDSDEAHTASFIVVVNAKHKSDALDWLHKVGLSASSVTSDGKFFIMKTQFGAGKWSDVLDVANELKDEHYEQTPALLYMAASAHLLQAVPEELRSLIYSHLPFDAAPIPLADDLASLCERRAARELYLRAAAAAASLGCVRAGYESSDRALWLGLRDPLTRDESRTELEQSMRNPAHSLRRLSLALQFRLKLDLPAVEQEIDRQATLSDGGSPDVALARFSMALTKNSPRDAADYISRHRDQLLKHLNPAYITSVEIQMLAQSGQIDAAENRMRELKPEDVSDQERQRLARIIAEAKGANPIESREAQFENSDALSDLAVLVEFLEEQKDWPRLVTYGRKFFDRTHDVASCQIYTRALFETNDFRSAILLFDKHSDLVEQSTFLQSIRAWSLYRIGDVKACREALNSLRALRDDPNDRVLAVQLSIASGDWISLGAFVEQEWQNRGDRTAGELVRAGQLAHHLGSARARDLIFEAAAKADEDPEILIGCYGVAVNAGWEDEETSTWLSRAAALSGDDGPVKRMSLKEVIDLNPEWRQREKQTWEKLQSGELPIFGAGHLLNRTLVDLFLIPAIANAESPDPRRRSAVYAYGGTRRFFRGAAQSAAFDPTSLLTLGLLGAIDSTFAYFDKIVIPHSMLSWLFEEKQRIQFHQPSKFAEAKEVKRLLDTGRLQRFEPTVTPNNELASEIGDDLAALFAEAEADFGEDRRQRLVVRSAPVHRMGSLMEEEADLGEHLSHVCGCIDVVIALARQGQLTQVEEQRARSYFVSREQPWPRAIAIEPSAVLYLDGLSVTYLQHLGILAKIHAAGLTAVVPRDEILQGDRLAQYETLSGRATDIIDNICRTFAAGISSGKIVLAPSTRGGNRSNDGIQHHPTFEVMGSAELADILIIDDRYFNLHGVIRGDFGARPVLTTYDVLTFTSQDSVELQEFVTGMRRSGLCFVPVRAEELTALMKHAAVREGQLLETAELKALRENLLLARMSSGLQLPNELVWLDSTTIAFIEAIKAQWYDGVDEESARARSNWLLEQFDVRQWSHRFTPKEQSNIAVIRYRAHVLLLAVLNTNVAKQTRQIYWRWFEAAILDRIREEERGIYDELISRARSIIMEEFERSKDDRNV